MARYIHPDKHISLTTQFRKKRKKKKLQKSQPVDVRARAFELTLRRLNSKV